MAQSLRAVELRVPLASAVKEAVCNLASEPCVAVVYLNCDVDVYHLERNEPPLTVRGATHVGFWTVNCQAAAAEHIPRQVSTVVLSFGRRRAQLEVSSFVLSPETAECALPLFQPSRCISVLHTDVPKSIFGFPIEATTPGAAVILPLSPQDRIIFGGTASSVLAITHARCSVVWLWTVALEWAVDCGESVSTHLRPLGSLALHQRCPTVRSEACMLVTDDTILLGAIGGVHVWSRNKSGTVTSAAAWCALDCAAMAGNGQENLTTAAPTVIRMCIADPAAGVPTMLALDSLGVIHLMNSQTQAVLVRLPLPYSASHIAVVSPSTDGAPSALLVTVNGKNSVHFWDLFSTLSQLVNYPSAHAPKAAVLEPCVVMLEPSECLDVGVTKQNCLLTVSRHSICLNSFTSGSA